MAISTVMTIMMKFKTRKKKKKKIGTKVKETSVSLRIVVGLVFGEDGAVLESPDFQMYNQMPPPHQQIIQKAC